VQRIVRQRLGVRPAKADRLGDARALELADRREPVAADQERRLKPGQAIDEPRAQQCRGQPGATLDQQSGDPAPG
jgi:hypothetical protein